VRTLTDEYLPFMEAGMIAVQALMRGVPQGDSPIKQAMLNRKTKITAGAMHGVKVGTTACPEHMPVLREGLQTVACLLQWDEAVTKLDALDYYLPRAVGVGVAMEDGMVVALACHCITLLKVHKSWHVGMLRENKKLGTQVVQALDVVVGQGERDLQGVARVCGAVVVLLEERREERATLRQETADGVVQVLLALEEEGQASACLVAEAIGVLARRSEGCRVALSRAGAVAAVEGMRQRHAWADEAFEALKPKEVETEGRRPEDTEQQSKRRRTK
jgi:hypothetical protein